MLSNVAPIFAQRMLPPKSTMASRSQRTVRTLLFAICFFFLPTTSYAASDRQPTITVLLPI